MKSTQALLLIALLTTTSTSGSSEESNEEVLYEGGRRASPVEECFCLNRHPMMVPVVEYLDSDSHGLSRLVVYLYKDQKTGKIHIYVPGVENQRKFPDVSLDLYGNEIFVVNNELTVTSVFEKSKNVIPLTVPVKTPQEPAVNEISAAEPEISPHQLLIYDFSNGNIQTHTESSSKIHTQKNPQTQPQIHTQTHSHTHSHSHSQNYSPSNPQTHTQTHTQSHSQSNPQVSESHSHPQNNVNGASKSVGGQFHYIYNSMNIDNKDIDDTPSIYPHLPYYELYQYPTSSGVEVSDGSFPIDAVPAESISTETIAADGGLSSNEGSWSSSSPATPSRPVGDEDAISAKRVSTAFDVWFKGQIKKVRSEQLTAHYVLDVKTLKANIEKILQENHIKLTSNGKLQDSDGNIMSFNRLKLRPVLIGDSVGYEKVKHRETFVFPKDLTYLEAILISVSYPPKILGIVPLRKISLQEISQGSLKQTATVAKSVTSKNKTSSATNVKSDKNDIHHDKSNIKQHQPQRQTTSKKGIKNNKSVAGSVEKEYNITFDNAQGLPSPADLENIFGKPPSKVSQQKSSNKTKSTTEAAVDGRKRLNSDEIEERAVAVNKNGNGRDTVDIFRSLLSQTLGKLKDIFPISILSENVEKEEENSTEDPLGFRIIGGDPATISGKMLNSRGRSGFIY